MHPHLERLNKKQSKFYCTYYSDTLGQPCTTLLARQPWALYSTQNLGKRRIGLPKKDVRLFLVYKTIFSVILSDFIRLSQLRQIYGGRTAGYSQRNCILENIRQEREQLGVNFAFVLTPKSAVKSSRETRRTYILFHHKFSIYNNDHHVIRMF